MSAVDQHAEAHRLKNDLGYGARRIAQELGVSRHAATQLLARPLPEPVADERRPVAEPVAEVADQERLAVGQVVDRRPPVAEAPVEGVVVKAQPVGHVTGAVRFPLPGARSPWLRMDLSRRPWLLRDLVRLARIGLQIPTVVDLAVRSFAAAYWQAVTRGELDPGQAYEVQTRVRPCRHAT